ncbi:class I SAM-dependent methyltransferase [Streptomyces sp. H23]|uniref:SAM-dependent methyltransferase n=1 Tax=Streptomyces sp. H23 TaxID=2541723 RepID=UPI00106EF28F|nr:class I SAM-dependent methyltransferase [Streptomyces sp. H23]
MKKSTEGNGDSGIGANPDEQRTGDIESELGLVQSAMSARARLRQWAAAGQVVDLLRAAASGGWLAALASPTTVESLAGISGVPTVRAQRVVDVFESAGIVNRVEGSSATFVLTAEFAALNDGPSGLRLDYSMDEVAAARDRVGSALSPAGSPRWEPDALAVARNWGMLPTAASQAIFDMAYAVLPEVRNRLAAGGPLLDVGSGTGGFLLANLAMFPKLRAVGVERAGDVVEELVKRAETAGVTDRLKVRHIDAQELADEAVYEVAYWAQAFFPRGSRAATLACVRNALVPGGILLVQELPSQAQDAPDARLLSALDALVTDSRGVPPVRTAEELTAELEDGGFEETQVLETALGRIAVGRRGN